MKTHCLLKQHTIQFLKLPICNPPSSENFDWLNQLKSENLFRIIIGHININSVRKKSESLGDLIRATLDVLMISETKIDETFPESQFTIKNFQNFTI